MFDVGLPELAVLAVVALFVFGPDRLPDVARQAGRMVRTARKMLANARAQVAEELGPEYANLDLNDLRPRTLIQRHLLDDLESDLSDEREPARPGHRPLEPGEQAPYDPEST